MVFLVTAQLGSHSSPSSGHDNWVEVSCVLGAQADASHTADALIFVCFLRLSRINSAHGTECGTQAAFHSLLISFQLEGNSAIFLVSTVVSLKV